RAAGTASTPRRPRRWATLTCVLLAEKRDPRRLPLLPSPRSSLRLGYRQHTAVGSGDQGPLSRSVQSVG
ncbi:hypothetical protein ACWC4J_43335, partial [Streptomyces sp. NPDC001356]